jgi:hypothetical protein
MSVSEKITNPYSENSKIVIRKSHWIDQNCHGILRMLVDYEVISLIEVKEIKEL